MLLGKGELPVFLLLGRNMKGFSGAMFKKFDTKDLYIVIKGWFHQIIMYIPTGYWERGGLCWDWRRGPATGSGETDQ